jgi:DNA-binding CsgD family transcriptional regulator
VLVTGPAGIGKTTLVEEVAGSTAGVVWGRAIDDEGAPPLWPWQRVLRTVGGVDQALRAAVSEFAGRAMGAEGAAAARFAIATAVTDFLIASAEPDGLVIVLEDLHWADDASLHLLHHLVRELRRSRVLVLGTARDAGAARWNHALDNLLRQPSVEVVRLGPLGESDVAAYLGQVWPRGNGPRAVAAVHAATGGNPLYLRTVARLLAEDASGGTNAEAVRQLVSSRPELRRLVTSTLQPLEPHTRTLLDAAAVIGEEIDAGLLRSVTGTPLEHVERDLVRAVDAGILVPVLGPPAVLRFVHALVRDVVYAELDSVAKADWHRRIAQALEPLARTYPERSGEVATQWLHVADAEALRRAAGWARRAADAATSAFAFVDAARFLTMALRALDGAGAQAEERAELLLGVARAEYWAGRSTHSIEHCLEAADAAELAGRPDLLAAAALVIRGIGRPGRMGGDPRGPAVVLALSQRALGLGAGLPAAVRAGLLTQQSLANGELDRWDEATQAADEALALAESSDDPNALLEATHARAMALDAVCHVAERLRIGARIAELARPLGLPGTEVWGRVMRMNAGYQLGDLNTVDDELNQIAELATASRLPLLRWYDLRFHATRATLGGRFGAARQLSAQARELGERMQEPAAGMLSHAFALSLSALRGDPEELLADADDEFGKPSPLQMVRAVRARGLFELGRREEAAAVYEELRTLPAVLKREEPAFASANMLLDLTVAFDDAETAQVMYERLRPFATHCGGPGVGIAFPWGSVSRNLGRLAALLGRHEDAIGHFRDALGANSRLGAGPLIVWTRLNWAETLADRGRSHDLAEAHSLARQAATEARRLDMPGPTGRADVLLRQLGDALQAYSPLTIREREVAILVASALTNHDIAERLVVSERTVESHVSNILRKLDLASRTHIATWALRSGFIPAGGDSHVELPTALIR